MSRLRRGIDKQFFHPDHRDRPLVEQRYGLPPDRFLLLYVGRLDEAKQPLIVVEAARRLLTSEAPVHVVFVGSGPLGESIQNELGTAASVIDPLPHEELRTVYASADVFVFPSATEVLPNVVLEAKASGLPVLLSNEGGAHELIQVPGQDGIVVGSRDPAEWAAAISQIECDRDLCRRVGTAARRHIETAWPSWEDVLRCDLLPVWRKLRSMRSLQP